MRKTEIDWEKVAKAAEAMGRVLEAKRCVGTTGVLACLTAMAFHASKSSDTGETAILALRLDPVVKQFMRGLETEGLPIKFIKTEVH